MGRVIVKIDSDEWYPVYSLATHGDEVEVDEGVVERWKRVTAEFDAVQREMEAVWRGADK